MLMELDTAATFKDVKEEATLEEVPEESKIKQLVTKLIDRQKEIDAHNAAMKSFYS